MGVDQQLSFPIIIKSGTNTNCKPIHYYFNYSVYPVTITYLHHDGKELLTGEVTKKDKQFQLSPWGVMIVEEN